MRRSAHRRVWDGRGISIHASRMGCDRSTVVTTIGILHFNPRIPYGMRHAPEPCAWQIEYFNPRIPYGMRPSRCRSRQAVMAFQSTHPVWDATSWHSFRLMFQHISIHASRMGCDAELLAGNELRNAISIHASRMGCDSITVVEITFSIYFNPRIPYGMRLREWTLHSIIWKLLPALRADYIADIPEHLSVCIFGL